MTRADAMARMDAIDMKDFMVELATTRQTHAKVRVRAQDAQAAEAEAEVMRRYFGEEASEPLGDLEWSSGELDDDVTVVGVVRT